MQKARNELFRLRRRFLWYHSAAPAHIYQVQQNQMPGTKGQRCLNMVRLGARQRWAQFSRAS